MHSKYPNTCCKDTYVRRNKGKDVSLGRAALSLSLSLSLLRRSSLFIVGPGRQCKNMFKEKRRICTLVYLGCMGGTVFLALFCKARETLALPRRQRAARAGRA